MVSVEGDLLDASVKLIQQVGFPVFVAGWFMFRLEKRLEKLTDAVNNKHGHSKED